MEYLITGLLNYKDKWFVIYDDFFDSEQYIREIPQKEYHKVDPLLDGITFGPETQYKVIVSSGKVKEIVIKRRKVDVGGSPIFYTFFAIANKFNPYQRKSNYNHGGICIIGKYQLYLQKSHSPINGVYNVTNIVDSEDGYLILFSEVFYIHPLIGLFYGQLLRLFGYNINYDITKPLTQSTVQAIEQEMLNPESDPSRISQKIIKKTIKRIKK